MLNGDYDNDVRGDYSTTLLGSISDFTDDSPTIPKIFIQILKARKKLHLWYIFQNEKTLRKKKIRDKTCSITKINATF
jgi:hypothetical protein